MEIGEGLPEGVMETRSFDILFVSFYDVFVDHKLGSWFEGLREIFLLEITNLIEINYVIES